MMKMGYEKKLPKTSQKYSLQLKKETLQLHIKKTSLLIVDSGSNK